MSDHSPDDAPGLTATGSAIAEVITVLMVLALIAFAGFVLLFPLLVGDF